MYQPPPFRSTDRALAARLMREHPFASLISNDDAGLPFATHLPLHLENRDDGFFLLGHCARPNPHWRYLQERPAALVTFLGPHAYQSPRAGYAQGNEQERELARWMDILEIGGPCGKEEERK